MWITTASNVIWWMEWIKMWEEVGWWEVHKLRVG